MGELGNFPKINNRGGGTIIRYTRVIENTKFIINTVFMQGYERSLVTFKISQGTEKHLPLKKAKKAQVAVSREKGRKR